MVRRFYRRIREMVETTKVELQSYPQIPSTPEKETTKNQVNRCRSRVTPTKNEVVSLEKHLPNGDLYIGTFLGNVPNGKGKYLWKDGCMYEGEWKKGKANGKGKFSWPSGATYEGEFKGGRMEGYGVFIGFDGDSYKGNWVCDKKQGYGEKWYVNGDYYCGSWRKNLQDGFGRYVWKNGNCFSGEWKCGGILGNGVLVWGNGNESVGICSRSNCRNFVKNEGMGVLGNEGVGICPLSNCGDPLKKEGNDFGGRGVLGNGSVGICSMSNCGNLVKDEGNDFGGRDESVGICPMSNYGNALKNEGNDLGCMSNGDEIVGICPMSNCGNLLKNDDLDPLGRRLNDGGTVGICPMSDCGNPIKNDLNNLGRRSNGDESVRVCAMSNHGNQVKNELNRLGGRVEGVWENGVCKRMSNGDHEIVGVCPMSNYGNLPKHDLNPLGRRVEGVWDNGVCKRMSNGDHEIVGIRPMSSYRNSLKNDLNPLRRSVERVWDNGVCKRIGDEGVGIYPMSNYGNPLKNDLNPLRRSVEGVWENGVCKRMSCGDDRVDEGSVAKRSNVGIPSICIWESEGEAGDITCDIIDNVGVASMIYGDGFLSLDRKFSSSPCCFIKEAKKPGQPISKGHKNYDLMLNLQLGIRYSVGKQSSILGELKTKDFDPKEKYWTRFPPEGSKLTPTHKSTEFRWKDYCPVVFRHLRDLFQVDTADYMLAICGNDALRELSSPGKSGSFFYLTQDDRFMIKTVKKSEVKVLLRMLPSYYQHVYRYENTLVTRFYGVHCVKPAGGPKTRFIVIGNLFCSEYRIHRRFDLKGSRHGRTTEKAEGDIDETTTLKDLDLDFVFRLQRNWYQELIKQIERDCEFLEAERIMDYSLLVGIHFRNDNTVDKMGLSPFVLRGKKASYQNEKYLRGQRFLEAELQDMDRVLAGRKPLIRLGANMPARAERLARRSDFDQYIPGGSGNLMPSRNGEIYEVILYFGIIDILQDYDISKRLEHAYKSLQADPTSISAVDPRLYSKRFRDFIGRIFVEDR